MYIYIYTAINKNYTNTVILTLLVPFHKDMYVERWTEVYLCPDYFAQESSIFIVIHPYTKIIQDTTQQETLLQGLAFLHI